MAYNPVLLNDPKVWALRPVEFKVYAALLTFCNPDGSGAYPTNRRLMDLVGMAERTLQSCLTALEEAGVISRAVERTAQGTYRTITVNYCCQYQRTSMTLKSDRVHSQAPEGVHGEAPQGAHSQAPEGVHGEAPQKTIPINDHSPKAAAAAEPPELPPPLAVGGLPNVKAGTLNMRRKPARYEPVQLGAIRDRFTAAFHGADRTALNYVSQEMVDTGFVAWAIGRMEQEAKKGYKNGPIAFFRSLVNDDWREGWEDVGEIAKAAADDEKKRRADRLKALMV